MRAFVLIACTGAALTGCGSEDTCGPTRALVVRAIDGDTVELESGERVRYSGVDTPESTNGKDDCYGQEAADYNAMLVEGKTVTLEYDAECTDRYDRLLAYVSVDGEEVNRKLVAEGYACTLFIPPNGADHEAEFSALESYAKMQSIGLWGACEVVTCD